MASEAQRLIGISLGKIAQARAHRGGVSLHKNLLVATVLQKARYIFMEEAYSMVHFAPPAPAQARPVPPEELPPAAAECRRRDKENQPPTYLDLDQPAPRKRRRVPEWETEEAVQSILPKRCREEAPGGGVEIDRITSLVSIFSFSVGEGKLGRSVSTPDLCSAQAKDADQLQQRPFLAMTV